MGQAFKGDLVVVINETRVPGKVLLGLFVKILTKVLGVSRKVYYLLWMGIIIGNRKRAFRLFSKPEERNKDCHILTVASHQVHCPSIHSRRTDNCQGQQDINFVNGSLD